MRSAALAALLAGLFGPGVVAPALSADLYKWMDDRGTIHYSSLPPPVPASVEHPAPPAKPQAVVAGEAVRDLRAAAKALSHSRPGSLNLPGSPSQVDRATSDSIAARLLHAEVAPVAAK
jgi:hypothetical protein